ncbi:hypothetical protein Tco_0598132 [Tanacetum coccineum]
MYYPRFTKVIIHYFLTQEKTLSWRNKIKIHTSKDDYLINTLRFVFAKEETQIYGAILPESLTSPEMKETKAYKTYLVSTEEPMGKLKRKEKVDVTRGKGIELPSQVALKEDAQFEEVQRKSMRDFHKTHPSGSGVVKIIPSVTSEGTSVKPGVLDVTEEESFESEAESYNENELDSEHETDENESGSESDQDEDEDDEEEMKDELMKTMSNDSDDEDETKITDNAEVDTDKGFVQEEGTDATMTSVQQGNENSEIVQVIEDDHVTLSTIP